MLARVKKDYLLHKQGQSLEGKYLDAVNSTEIPRFHYISKEALQSRGGCCVLEWRDGECICSI